MNINNKFISNMIVCNEKKDVDLDALNLLASGDIKEFCQCSYVNKNKHHHFIYDTDGLGTFVQVKSKLSFEDVILLLMSAKSMLQAVLRNKFTLDNVKNSVEYIFKSANGFKFVYVPIVHKSHVSVKKYLIKLMYVINFKDVRIKRFVKELCDKKDDNQVMEFLDAFISSYTYVCDGSDEMTSLLSWTDNEETTLLGKSEISEIPKEKSISKIRIEDETTVLNKDNHSEELYDFYATSESIELTASFSDESSEYETTVLTSQSINKNHEAVSRIENEYYLYLTSNTGKMISIDITPFTIGKDSRNMDLVLCNDSISRSHATIIFENGEYFIVDNGSTNGTIVEGIKIQKDEKCEIENGYMISFGNMSFQVHIERK